MRKRMLWCACILFVALTVAGCSDEISQQDIPSITFAPERMENNRMNIDIYWDATYSMQGYTTIEANNAYRALPDDLDDLGSSLGETRFFSFGEDIKELDGREHRKFADAGGYTETITAVDNVIDNADNKNLSVIVTDLFESDSDWSNITKRLKEKYFSQHLSVAVIGIKNPFKGKIFDVGLSAAKFDYDSGSDTSKYRPFYMFILGQDSDVKRFVQSYKNRYTRNNEIQYLILSENLMDKSVDLSNMDIKDSDNIFADESLILPNSALKEYDIDSPDELSSITAEFTNVPADNSCKLDMGKLKTNVTVFTLKEGEWIRSNKVGDINCVFEEDNEQPDSYLISLSFTADKTLESDAVNLIHVAVQPDSNGLIIPEWVKEWSMDNSTVSEGILQEQFDGSKTINFLHIIESLKESILTTAQPSLINMNLVIQN